MFPHRCRFVVWMLYDFCYCEDLLRFPGFIYDFNTWVEFSANNNHIFRLSQHKHRLTSAKWTSRLNMIRIRYIRIAVNKSFWNYRFFGRVRSTCSLSIWWSATACFQHIASYPVFAYVVTMGCADQNKGIFMCFWFIFSRSFNV